MTSKYGNMLDTPPQDIRRNSDGGATVVSGSDDYKLSPPSLLVERNNNTENNQNTDANKVSIDFNFTVQLSIKQFHNHKDFVSLSCYYLFQIELCKSKSVDTTHNLNVTRVRSLESHEAGDDGDVTSSNTVDTLSHRRRSHVRGSSLRHTARTSHRLGQLGVDSCSDSDQDGADGARTYRRHSYREPRSQSSADTTSRQRVQNTQAPSNGWGDMLLVSDRYNMRRHSAVSVLSDSVAINMARRPSTYDNYMDRRPSHERRRPSVDRLQYDRRSSGEISAGHGDTNNITIVVSQDKIGDINSNEKGEMNKILCLFSRILFLLLNNVNNNCKIVTSYKRLYF